LGLLIIKKIGDATELSSRWLGTVDPAVVSHSGRGSGS
jgi:hypothetical protein